MPAEKKKWPPWIVFALKAVYACACGVFIGFLVVLFTGTRSTFGTMRSLQNTALEQQKLPGAAELRTDGCQQVMVSTPAFRAAHPIGTTRGKAFVGTETWVTCMPLLLKTPPTCDRLARHYVAVAHPPGNFTVMVQGPMTKTNCHERFDATGLPILADGGI